MREYPITVTMLDINSAKGQALALQEGILFPPGVLINGEGFSYGRLSERKLWRK